MKSLLVKLILIFLLCAIIPVLISYLISINKVRETNETSVSGGNLAVALAASNDVQNYFQNGFEILKNMARVLEQIPMQTIDQDHLLKMTYANHPYFQHITLTDLMGRVIATSSFTGPARMDLPEPIVKADPPDHVMTKVYIAQDPPPVRPAIDIFIPIHVRGELKQVLCAELNLIYAWHLVHKMKVGQTGEIFLLDSRGQIFASSNMSILFRLEPYPGYTQLLSDGKIAAKTFVVGADRDIGDLVTVVPVKFPQNSALVITQKTEEAFALSNTVARQILVLTLLVISLMLVFGYLGVKKMVLSPVKILTTGLEKIASGLWEHRIRISSGDEFENMGRHYNAMAGQLFKQADKIRRQERLSLIGKISGGLVHDLKHPITNIRNWTKLMPAKINDPDFVNTFTDVVNREFGNVDQFFISLKELTSEITLQRQVFPISRLFAEIEKRFELDAKNLSVQLDLRCEGSLSIHADYFLLGRVFSNLISNALQAVKAGGLVCVRAVREPDDRISFMVSDSGHGIAPERLDTLFEDFTTTKKRGLGLGLAITKKIIELHGGDITAKSQLDAGTVFSFWIPDVVATAQAVSAFSE